MNKKLKVLLIEDNWAELKIYQKMLRDAGFMVVPARNGQEAIDILDEGDKLDAIVTNLFMPKVDGRALAKYNFKNHHLPFIVLPKEQTLKPPWICSGMA